MYIRRHLEDEIKQRIKTCKCIMLTGARQVGKTTLYKEMFPDTGYITFDDKLLLSNAVEDPKLFLKKQSRPLIMDEIQYASELFPYIKIDCDSDDTRGKFLLTGSQQMKLMQKTHESLAGRISIMELQGLSLRELNNVNFNRHFIPTEEYITERENNLKNYSDLWKTIHRGMYPEICTTDRKWSEFYSSYVKTYIERDIREEIEIKDEIVFTKFLSSCAARTGQILNYSGLSNEIGVSEVTIKNWVSVLNRTGIIYLLQPYFSNHLNRALKTPKLYFRDTGLACYLSRWNTSDALETGAYAGNIFETFIVDEIIKTFVNEGSEYDFSLFYYRGRDRKYKGEQETENEIDLVIEENGTLYPIEIKKSANPDKSMAATFDILDKEIEKKRGTGVILCQTDRKLYLKDNLIALPIEYI